MLWECSAYSSSRADFLLKLQEKLGNGFECFDALDSLGKSHTHTHTTPIPFRDQPVKSINQHTINIRIVSHGITVLQYDCKRAISLD